tara:strand:- start:278 stop:412 length:135 start_codon:yes stop_codon:yes gene_type:complete
MRRAIVNSFRQVVKYEDVQDAFGTMFLAGMFMFAVFASTGKIFS